jgi:allophanate hydrolase
MSRPRPPREAPERIVVETVADILAAHRARTTTPEETIRRSYARIRAYDDPAVFITLRDEREALAEARALADRDRSLPLYGIPVAVKDNIDVKGLPTTTACPAFAYQPARDATAVARLREAGAIVIGKTNLDQFATGLVGVRSPYGVPRNSLDPALIPGGSSSGSAVAVAAGLVPLALGTDTAGSGRVPAMLNNIVGLKPSLGLVSTAGVVPACRTLDCVSVFALTTDDCWAALAVMAGHDDSDAYSRTRPLGTPGAAPAAFRVGVPRPSERVFFGDDRAAKHYAAALDRLAALGASVIEIDIEPFYEAAKLLYEGPWVAERYAAAESLIASSPDAMYPITRAIILGGARPTALAAFKAFYRLEELRRAAEHTFREVDILALPTAPTTYTVAQVLADPIQLNSRLGTYTNFVNLFDLCGLALPAALHDARPFGVTLLAPGGADAVLATIGRVFHADTKLPLGALRAPQPLLAPLATQADGGIALAVVGAHLSGMPLNHELTTHGARLIATTMTAADYRLYALDGAGPRKPGLLRVAPGRGSAIAVEIWALPADGFGRFVAAIPAPLSIGSVKLADGRIVKGFLVEAEAAYGARDISSFGGWRAFVAAQREPA